jgi:ubiquinone biosynthesis protein COQ9
MAMSTRQLRLRALYRESCRRFHSYDHPAPPGPFNSTEEAILRTSLAHVPVHGFTQTSLAIGAKDAGYLDASANIFPNGAFSLVHYHLVAQRLQLAKHSHIIAPSQNEQSLSIGAKVKALTWERLLSNQEIIHRWQEVRFQPLTFSTW